jgi:5-deoxy-glucuronate isomerase
MYIDKTVVNGYNPYLTVRDDAGTGLTVGVLSLDTGESHTFLNAERETAVLLLQGRALFRWEGEERSALRPDSFHHQPWCLHVCRGTEVRVTAGDPSEFYVQTAENPRAFPAKFYAPENVQVQHAGANGELQGCMRREIKTLFDYESAPYSNMVLGEVLNFPGKWSSYPPHCHPQPEVYLHRFDRPQGFGASFANGEVYTSRHNGLTVIKSGFHSQVAAPGYAMMYVWGIRHLEGDPWRKTRIDVPEHEWLWQKDANQKMFSYGLNP